MLELGAAGSPGVWLGVGGGVRSLGTREVDVPLGGSEVGFSTGALEAVGPEELETGESGLSLHPTGSPAPKVKKPSI